MDAAATFAADMGLGPGDLIAGKYRVVRVIGHGGMGVVAEAVHEGLEQRVAIKFLRHQGEAHEEAATRFLLEAKALAQFKSLHFARVTDIARLPDGTPYFVMEYLEGHDLAGALAVDGVLPVATAVDYALQVCEALAEAHSAGIIHRDIKPSNVFLSAAADGSTLVKLLDFGISKHTTPADEADLNITRTRALMGSPRYMAPEQMRSQRRIDLRVDIWSLGVVLHEALTGQPPFVGETLPEVCAAIAADDPVRARQLRREVPIELQDIILRCLAKDPEHRYKDVALLASDLAPFASPEAAFTARRVGRILKGASMPPSKRLSYPAPAPTTIAPRTDVPLLVAQVTPASEPPPASHRLEAGRDSLALLGPANPAESDPAARPLKRWALVIIAAVALPAFVVGALVPSPAPTPNVRPPPARTATPPEAAAVPSGLASAPAASSSLPPRE